MQQSASVQIRVNGVLINQVRLRGLKSDPRLVIVDPVIGAFEIDDGDNRFQVEVLDLNLPPEARAADPNGGWKPISVQALIALLRGATEGQPAEDTPRSSWLHASDLAEIDGLTPCASPHEVRVERGFRKAARLLYVARIPYLIVGAYDSPEDAARTALVIVPDAPRAHERLCANGFKPHPSDVNSVISPEYNCAVHFVPSRKQKRNRRDSNESSQS